MEHNQGWSAEYASDWRAVLQGDPLAQQILDFGRMMGNKIWLRSSLLKPF
jgi:hypothetical protein